MTRTADVVVVGAGIVGASCAWHLAQRGLRVVVLERERAAARGTTGRSAAGVRVQFSHEPNVRLSVYSLDVLRNFEARYGHAIGYRSSGYLLLATEENWGRHLEAVEMQRACGAPVDVVPLDAISDFIPIVTDGLAGATYGPIDGVIDAIAATEAMIELARGYGAEIAYGADVQSIERVGDGWSIATTSDTYASDVVVNAAGCWSGLIAGFAHLDLPVRPTRKQIFISKPRDGGYGYPFAIDVASCFYIRGEGDGLLFGQGTTDDAFGFTEGIDWSWHDVARATGVQRYPWLADVETDREKSWWGYYAVTPDHNPIIGRHPNATNWIDACGFSGHGVMHSPATGLIVSEVIADGQASTLDASAFGHQRFESAESSDTYIF